MESGGSQKGEQRRSTVKFTHEDVDQVGRDATMARNEQRELLVAGQRHRHLQVRDRDVAAHLDALRGTLADPVLDLCADVLVAFDQKVGWHIEHFVVALLQKDRLERTFEQQQQIIFVGHYFSTTQKVERKVKKTKHVGLK